MHAHAAENLLSALPAADFAGGAVLDVGSGSGYRESLARHVVTSRRLRLADAQRYVSYSLARLTAVTAVFHHLVPHATVVGIDHMQGLVDMAEDNLAKDGIKLGAGPGKVEIICGDGRLGEFYSTLRMSRKTDRRIAPAWSVMRCAGISSHCKASH